MKVLKPLAMLLICSSIYANENNATLNRFLSKYKQQLFEYDYRKNEQEGLKLRDSWIAPIRLNFTYNRSKPYDDEQVSQSYGIAMNQPIFRSGGIYYGIKFANANRLYKDYTVDVAKRKMIKDTVATLMQIKQTELKHQRQELQIKNSQINLEQKKEQYLSGQLDSGFLDNAIIQLNLVKQNLYDIESTKESLISQFHTLSDLDYRTIEIPHLRLLNAKEFLKHNIVLQQVSSQIKQNKYSKNITIAKYLPNVSFVAGYTWQDNQNQMINANGQLFDSSSKLDYYNYGIQASMPLDINTFRDVESVKIDYLKSKVLKLDKQRELQAVFEKVMHNIENFDKKIMLSKENRKLYAKLLDDTKKLYQAGYKTQYDVETLQNSLQIQKLDTKIFELQKQLELLTLYEMYVNDGE